MKEIISVIRMNKINKTKAALSLKGISSFSAQQVMGRGKGSVDFKVLKGAQEGYEEAIAQLGQGQRLVPKRMLTIVVPDDLVEDAVQIIIETNHTGNPGDGKIFVMPIKESYRIRTGESGESVLDEAQ